jgi:hypothetical protein
MDFVASSSTAALDFAASSSTAALDHVASREERMVALDFVALSSTAALDFAALSSTAALDHVASRTHERHDERMLGRSTAGSLSSSRHLTETLVEGATEDGAEDDSEDDVELSAASRLQVGLTVLTSCAFLGASTLVFFGLESQADGQQWDLFDTFWFLVVTTTSIGFGDITLDWNRNAQTAVETVLIMLGLVITALATGIVADLLEHEISMGGEVADEGFVKFDAMEQKLVALVHHKIDHQFSDRSTRKHDAALTAAMGGAKTDVQPRQRRRVRFEKPKSVHDAFALTGDFDTAHRRAVAQTPADPEEMIVAVGDIEDFCISRNASWGADDIEGGRDFGVESF